MAHAVRLATFAVALVVSSSAHATPWVYCIGGTTGSATTGNVWMADILGGGTIGAWQATTSLPVNSKEHWATSFGYDIINLGGNTSTGSGSGVIADAYVGPTLPGGGVVSWTSVAPLPIP